jgi:hypothetical protein
MAAIQKRKRGDIYYLYLDYTENGKRTQESIGLKLLVKPVTPKEKLNNQEVQKEAESLLAAKVLDLNGYKNIDILVGLREWSERYPKKDSRSALQATNWFARYCDEVGVARVHSATLKISFINDFGEWLNSQYVTKGTKETGKREEPVAKETKMKIFKKFRIYLKMLFEDGYITWPPMMIKVKWKKEKARVKKPTPKGFELDILMGTPMPHEKICKAFLFCIMTGLDYISVHEHIHWSNITADYRLNFDRSKTGKTNSIQLNKTAIGCLPDRGGDEERVFDIPTHVTCMKWIRRWFADAGIKNADKFTWHSARHTIGMILGNEKKVPMAVVGKIYGHSSITETEKYYRAYDEHVDEAVHLIG